METLIVNVDYCGTCAGTCPTCVLSKDERLSQVPLISTNLIDDALCAISNEIFKSPKQIALGLGRGNHLVMNENSISDITEVAISVLKHFHSAEYSFEISTSLVGKIDRQIDRAKLLINEINSKTSGKVDVRFVVVANATLSSPKYWDNVKKFLNDLSLYRKTLNLKETGDIVQINLSLSEMPDPHFIAEKMGNHGSPLNIAWVPAFDEYAKHNDYLAKIGTWLTEFYLISKEKKYDCNLITWGERALRAKDFTMEDLKEHSEFSSKSLIYISQDGQWHNGFPTILADFDPIRFDPESRNSSNNVIKDLSKMMKNPFCRSCDYLQSCIYSGGHKISLVVQRNKSLNNVCYNGLSDLFKEIEKNV